MSHPCSSQEQGHEGKSENYGFRLMAKHRFDPFDDYLNTPNRGFSWQNVAVYR